MQINDTRYQDSSMLMIYLLQLLSLHRRRYQQLKRPVVALLCSPSMTTTTTTLCTFVLLFLIFQQQQHYPSTTISTAWILRPPISTLIHIQQQQQQQQKCEPFRMKNCRIHHLLSTTITTEHIDDYNDDDDDDNYINDNENNDNENNNNINNNTNHFELWEVGNVENDFDKLQQAIIMYQNSQPDLYHIERINTLNHFALHHKHPFHNTLHKFIILPLFISYISSLLFNVLLQSKSIILNTISTTLLRMIQLVSMTQFWSILIITPTILLYLVGRQYNRNISIHKNLYNNIDDVDDQYNHLQYLISPTNDSKRSITSSTRNYVQCILEQWVSCVSTVGIATTIYLFFLSKMKLNNMKIPIIINTLLLVQILTRLGSIASIQQYQSLYYTIQQKHQARPISWNVWSLQQLISYANNIWWIIFDVTYLSVISKTVQQCVLLLLTSSMLLWLSIVSSEKWIQQQQHSNNNDNSDDIIVQSRLRANQLILQVQQFTNFILKLIFPVSLWYCYRQGVFDMIQKILLSHNNNKVISITAAYLLTALIGPICHFIAITKIIKIRYTNNASLAMNENEFQQYFNSPDKWKWRYMIQWRQPQRIHITIQQYWQQIWYWLFVRGSVEEQLQLDRRQLIRGTTIKSHRSIILQKVADESLSSSSLKENINQNDRTKWKELAMQRIAQKHQEDYERGTYDDPLGVAVYRTLGIGLGFNYDHMSTLNSTETPSIRRLQARAAKSAIRRVNELYNADVAKQTLEQITDPVERSKKATAMRQEAEMEVQQLAERLADLIPIDQTSDVSASPLQIEQYNTGSYMHTSKHQYTLPSLQTESPALKNLFNEYIVHKNDTKPETYDVDYLNPMGESDQSSDDEYISEWLNKYRNSGFVNKENIDDEENTIETMLV